MKRLSTLLLLMSMTLSAQLKANTDANIQYMTNGQAVTPWAFGLEFLKVKYQGEKVTTPRSSLSATPAKKIQEGDAIRLKWNPKGIKTEWGSINQNILTANLTNTSRHLDLTSVLGQAALSFDVKVNKKPKKNVELMIECGWDWKCRSKFPLKNALKRMPKGEWASLPIPLKCFDNGSFDFSKITTVFSLMTTGKMDIEIANIQLVALPPSGAACG